MEEVDFKAITIRLNGRICQWRDIAKASLVHSSHGSRKAVLAADHARSGKRYTPYQQQIEPPVRVTFRFGR